MNEGETYFMTVKRKIKDTGGEQKEPESLVSAEFSQRLDSRQKTPLVPAVTCYLGILAVWAK